MLKVIVAALLAGWVVGVASSQTGGGLIHVLPVTAAAFVLIDFLASRKVRRGHPPRSGM